MGCRSISDDEEMQPIGMVLDEASLHVSEEDAEAFHQFLDEARLHVSEQDADAFHQSRSLYVSHDTCHGTRGGGDQMTKHQAAAPVRDDVGFFDSVTATGSLRKLSKPKNESIRTGTKRRLEGTVFIIGDYENGTVHKRQAAPRTSTSGPTRWRKGLVSRCAEARQQAITRGAEATAVVEQV